MGLPYTDASLKLISLHARISPLWRIGPPTGWRLQMNKKGDQYIFNTNRCGQCLSADAPTTHGLSRPRGHPGAQQTAAAAATCMQTRSQHFALHQRTNSLLPKLCPTQPKKRIWIQSFYRNNAQCQRNIYKANFNSILNKKRKPAYIQYSLVGASAYIPHMPVSYMAS